MSKESEFMMKFIHSNYFELLQGQEEEGILDQILNKENLKQES